MILSQYLPAYFVERSRAELVRMRKNKERELRQIAATEGKSPITRSARKSRIATAAWEIGCIDQELRRRDALALEGRR